MTNLANIKTKKKTFKRWTTCPRYVVRMLNWFHMLSSYGKITKHCKIHWKCHFSKLQTANLNCVAENLKPLAWVEYGIYIHFMCMCVCVRDVKKRNIEGSFGPFWTIMSLSRVAGGQLGGRRGQIMLLHHVTLYLIIFYMIHVFGRNESECPKFGDSKSPRIRTLRTLGQFRWEKNIGSFGFFMRPSCPNPAQVAGIDCLVCNAGAMTPKRTRIFWTFGFGIQLKIGLHTVPIIMTILDQFGVHVHPMLFFIDTYFAIFWSIVVYSY